MTVKAIQTPADVEAVHTYLLNKRGIHFADLWKLNVNLALRITDALSITMAMARDALDCGHLRFQESKTAHRNGKRTNHKARVIKLNANARAIIARRIQDYPHFDYLFQSVSRNVKTVKPISRQAAYDAFNSASKIAGVNLGTHSCRKSRGAIMHNNGIPVAEISKVLGHKNIENTMHYLGIDQERVDKLNEEFNL